MKQNIIELLTKAASADKKQALPILSFPAAQKLGVTVDELVKNSELQAKAIETDPEVVKMEIEETVKVCIKYGCPYDITLKDISMVSNRPENLITWAKITSEVLDKYYN